MLLIFLRGFLQASKKRVSEWWPKVINFGRDEWEHWSSVARSIREFGKDDTSEWPLVTAVPARQSLAPRSVNRAIEKAKAKR